VVIEVGSDNVLESVIELALDFLVILVILERIGLAGGNEVDGLGSSCEESNSEESVHELFVLIFFVKV
jgi:hypothetical protein